MASDMEPSDGEDDHNPELAGYDFAGDSEDEGGGLAGFRGSDDDDDDDEDGDDAGFAPRGLKDSDDEDDDDEVVPGAEDDDDDDEEESARAANGAKQKGITQYFGAKGGAPAAKSKSAAASGSSSNRAPPKNGRKAWAMDNGSDDDDDDDGSDAEPPTRVGGLVKKSLSLSAVDPLEEHDQLRRAHANGKAAHDAAEAERDAGATTEVVPKVDSKIYEDCFVLKNDKGPAARRFYGLLDNGMMGRDYRRGTATQHAPNYSGAEDCAFAITVEQVLAPRKDRDAMLSKLANERMAEIIQEVQIWKAPVDPAGNLSGPGIVNVVGFLPCRVADTKEATDGLHAKLPMEHVGPEPVFLLPVEEKLMKRVYKVGRGSLPRAFDPNAHSSVKYRVWGKLEDQEKIDEHVNQFAPPAATKAKRSKRPAENGGGSDAKKKAAKLTPQVGASSSSATTNGDGLGDDDGDDDDDLPPVDKSDHCFSRLKWTEIPAMGIEMAGIKCNPNQTVTVHPAGNGQFILVKSAA